jgi:uncharacterized membrane protein
MTPSTPQLSNIQAIVGLERETRDGRSILERLIDGVSGLASSPVFIAAHVLWFSVWIGVNTLGRAAFDRYPFSLLTLAVSLEADRRAHLDLQINLLAEQELTAILKLQCLLAERAGIDVSAVDPRLDQLRTHTDVQQLAATIATEMASTEPTPAQRDEARI